MQEFDANGLGSEDMLYVIGVDAILSDESL